MGYHERLRAELEGAKGRGLYRVLPDFTGNGLYAEVGGCTLLNLSGNDYLGLSAHPELVEKFLAQGALPSLSASSSRLLTGNHPQYRALEAELASLYGNRSALAVNSGYHANVGALPALAREGDLILSDELNHASIIDGIRLSRAKCLTYPHLNLAALETLLEENRPRYRDVIIVTESLFSMDGDIADLRALVRLKNAHDALLYVDEAHSVGVYGPSGLGLAEEMGVLGEVDVLVGTFGKAFCSSGAFIASEPVLREYLVNTMRTLLFTTGLAPLTIAWTRFVLARIAGMGEERNRLLNLSAKLRGAVAARGEGVPGRSQIVPLILGSNEAATAEGKRLRALGFLASPIRPPTVPEGRARIRFSLNAAIPEGELDRLISVL